MRAAIDEIERIEKLEASEVKRVAGQYLKREKRCVVIGKPQ